MKGKMPEYTPESTANINVQDAKAKVPKLTVGAKVTAEMRGTVQSVHQDKDGYTCTIALSDVTFGGQAPKSLSDQLKAAKHGKAEEMAEGE